MGHISQIPFAEYIFEAGSVASTNCPAQEIPPGAEDLITWDANPEEAGHLIAEIPADDEADVSAAMADEGRSEAEQDLRCAARGQTD